MVVVAQLQRQFIKYTTSLYNEGYLDDQFTQLQKLQDDSNPDFVVEVVSLFFEDSEKLLNNLTTSLLILMFTSSRAVVPGVQRVTNMFVVFRNYCEEKNLDGCLQCLQQVKHEYVLVRNNMEALFRLEQQILQAGGSIPMME